ncbi:MAG: YlbF family regulator [Verrucomicrobiota bacterium]
MLIQSNVTLEEKVRELCQFILDEPGFSDARGSIEAFLGDQEAQAAYQQWQKKGQELHRMNHEGLSPNEEDINEVQALQKAVMENPVAHQFTQAEEHMNQIFGTVTTMVQKTLQMGRVPTEEEMQDSGCCGGSGGGGCGCD